MSAEHRYLDDTRYTAPLPQQPPLLSQTEMVRRIEAARDTDSEREPRRCQACGAVTGLEIRQRRQP